MEIGHWDITIINASHVLMFLLLMEGSLLHDCYKSKFVSTARKSLSLSNFPLLPLIKIQFGWGGGPHFFFLNRWTRTIKSPCPWFIKLLALEQRTEITCYSLHQLRTWCTWLMAQRAVNIHNFVRKLLSAIYKFPSFIHSQCSTKPCNEFFSMTERKWLSAPSKIA